MYIINHKSEIQPIRDHILKQAPQSHHQHEVVDIDSNQDMETHNLHAQFSIDIIYSM